MCFTNLFIPYAKIIKFVSPVGNNDVPYPYAVDQNNYYYLLIENVVIKKVTNIHDPYIDFYNKILITNIQQPEEYKFKNITDFYIGKNKYNLNYVTNYSSNYNRLSSINGLSF